MADENAPPLAGRMVAASQRMRQLAAAQILKSSALSAGNSSTTVALSGGNRMALADVSQKHLNTLNANGAPNSTTTDKNQAGVLKAKPVLLNKPTVTLNLKPDATMLTAKANAPAVNKPAPILAPAPAPAPSHTSIAAPHIQAHAHANHSFLSAPQAPPSLSKELEASLSDMSLSPSFPPSASSSHSLALASSSSNGLSPISTSSTSTRNCLPPVDHSHFLVHEYIDDIMSHLKSRESRYLPHSNYMSRQGDINWRMREILIDWLHEVHSRFKLQEETLFLTVNLVDRFLQVRAVDRSKLQLIGCVAMLLAAKYEEIYVPEVDDFVHISDHAYRREEVIHMESYMLSTLGFHLTVPSPLRFSQRYLRLAHIASLATVDGYRHDDACHLISYLLQCTLQCHGFLKYLPSCIAASTVYLALHAFRIRSWCNELEKSLGYSLPNLTTPIDPAHPSNVFKQCISEMWTMVEAMERNKYNAVARKFAKTQFNAISRVKIPKPFE